MIRDLIYDVGMNNGDDTAYYLHRGFRVVAIEADPTLVAQAQQRFARQIAAGRLTILNVGITATPGYFPFYVSEGDSVFNSFDHDLIARHSVSFHVISIPGQPFRSILAEQGVPYYLKVDIEGYDYLCLQDLRPTDLPLYVSVEADPSGLSRLERLHDLGYTRFKCISQFDYLPVEVPPHPEQIRTERLWALLNRPHPILGVVRHFGLGRWLTWQILRTRRQSGWRFAHGSSGPFGEDTLGQWQTFEAIGDAYQSLQQLSQAQRPQIFLGTGYLPWCDWHASRPDVIL